MNRDSNLELNCGLLTTEKVSPLPRRGYYNSRAYISNHNINPLVAAGDQLFNLIALLPAAETPADQKKWLKNLSLEIRSFEHRALLANYPHQTIIMARYLLCLVIDSNINSTGWSNGNPNHLFSLFFKGQYSDNQLLNLFELALTDIPNQLHLIELYYLGIKLGWLANYVGNSYNSDQILIFSERFYQIIQQHNKHHTRKLLIAKSTAKMEASLNNNRGSIKANSTFKKTIIAGWLVVVMVTGLTVWGFRLSLAKHIAPIYSTLDKIKTGTNGANYELES